MRRLLGLLLILRALAPILALLVVVGGVSRVAGDFQVAWEAPLDNLETELAQLSSTFETAKQQFEIAKQDIDAVRAQLRAFQIPNLLPNLPLNITFPSVNIPDLTVAVPTGLSVQWSRISIPFDGSIGYPSGISISTTNLSLSIPDLSGFSVPFPGFFNDIRNGLNNLFSEFFDIFNLFDDALTALNELGESLAGLPDNFNRLVSEGQQLVSGLQALLAKWSGLLALTLLLTLALIVISFGVTFLELFGRGLRLLFERAPET